MKRFALLPLSMVSVCSTGCILTTYSSTTMDGAPVRRDFLDDLEPGKTTRSSLEDRLGPPSSVEEDKDGTMRLIYAYSNKTDTQVSVLLLVAFADSDHRRMEYVFEMKDGVLQRHYSRPPCKCDREEGRCSHGRLTAGCVGKPS